MKLELADFPVHEMELGTQTRYSGGTLEVSERELLELVLEDDRILRARIELARPGESCRITGIRDAVEPRTKVDGPGSTFPGVLGSSRTVGQGRTHRLSGMAVLPVADIPYSGPVSLTAPSRGSILDMSDPAASPLASKINLVLLLEVDPNLAELEQHQAIQQSEFKLARRLAEATAKLTPESVTVHQLAPVDPSLPRVVVTQQLRNFPVSPESAFYFYGMPLRDFLPMWVHPNELLDGALSCGTIRNLFSNTWEFCNHPVVSGLYARHGKDLNFLGMILARNGYDSYKAKEHVATQIAKLAHGLGAGGAVVCWTGGGHTYTEVMLTVQACEQVGIKAAHLTWEQAQKEDEPPLLFTVPEADALVSLGRNDRRLSDVERVIGPAQISIDPRAGAASLKVPAQGSMEAQMGGLGLQDHFGLGVRTCVEF